jgi:hippurate hydrolase
MILAFQTIVSRKIDPALKAVVTVGSIHGGTKHNVIPDEVKLQLTVRSYEDDTREKLLAEIRHIAEKTAEAHRAPRPPEVKLEKDYTPAGYHDPGLCDRLRAVFERLLGTANVRAAEPVMGGEDFSRFARHYGVPGLQFQVGAVAPGVLERGEPVAALHSGKWAADPERTLRTGVLALSRAVLDLLGRP